MAYTPGKNGTFTFNSITMKATDVTISREIGEIDFTNLTSSGANENSGDITKTTFSCTVVVDSAAVPNLAPDQSGTTTLAVTGGRTITGTARIYNAEHRVGPRGAYTIAVRGAFTGTVTES